MLPACFNEFAKLNDEPAGSDFAPYNLFVKAINGNIAKYLKLLPIKRDTFAIAGYWTEICSLNILILVAGSTV